MGFPYVRVQKLSLMGLRYASTNSTRVYQLLQFRHEQQCIQQSTAAYTTQINDKTNVSLQRTLLDGSSSSPSFFVRIISGTTGWQALHTTLLQLVHITQNHSVLTILTMLQKHRHWYLLMLIIMPPYNASNLHTPPGKKSENTAFHHFRSAVPVQPVTTNHTYKCCGGGWNCCFQTG